MNFRKHLRFSDLLVQIQIFPLNKMYAILSFVSCGVGVFYSFALTTMLETYILSGQNLNDAMLRYTAVLIRTIISNRINLTYLLKNLLFLEIVHILLIVTQPTLSYFVKALVDILQSFCNKRDNIGCR